MAKLDARGAGTPTVSYSTSPTWGTSPSITLDSGSNDSRGRVSAVAGSGSPAANPTVTITFSTPFEVTPQVFVFKDDQADTEGYQVPPTISTTAFTVVLDGTPTASTAYDFKYLVVG